MVRSELIAMMVEEFPTMPAKKVESIVNAILDTMVKTLSSGGRIEIRGFGTWCVL